MYFSRVTLNRAAEPTRLAAVARADAYRAHQYLWELFPGDPEHKRDFLFRRNDHGAWPEFYLVSARLPEDWDGAWRIQHKAYQPQIAAGERLAFQLRANPVVTRSGEGGRKRHDVIMDAKRRLDAAQRPPLAALVQSEGFAWLDRRAADHGFALREAEVQVDGYQRHELLRRGGRVRFSSVDFTGLLTVTDPERFRDALYRGIGPAKGFGCGLLLVRRL